MRSIARYVSPSRAEHRNGRGSPKSFWRQTINRVAFGLRHRMEFELEPTAASHDPAEELDSPGDSSFRISSHPVIEHKSSEPDLLSVDLPRSYGTQTLCLMARDPRTLFAYWDIDWPAAFRDAPPKNRKVHLRVLDSEGAELTATEVEPMAGNSYITVPEADSAYRGEIGYFNPPAVWNRLASSEVVTTPADSVAETEEADFATVPFHLSFQHMIDLLRISKQENESLTSMLADLRQRAASAEEKETLTHEERELAQVMNDAAASAPSQSRPPGPNEFWTQERIEKILGVGGTSPAGEFGGSSRGF